MSVSLRLGQPRELQRTNIEDFKNSNAAKVEQLGFLPISQIIFQFKLFF
jgi:hypothetical protein